MNAVTRASLALGLACAALSGGSSAASFLVCQSPEIPSFGQGMNADTQEFKCKSGERGTLADFYAQGYRIAYLNLALGESKTPDKAAWYVILDKQ